MIISKTKLKQMNLTIFYSNNFIFIFLFFISAILHSFVHTKNSFESDDSKNYYEILECTKECKLAEIKKNYRKLALELHPDKIPMNITNEQKEVLKNHFLDIQAAYQTLSDPERKLRYDLSFEGSIVPYLYMTFLFR